jgi:quinol monooxygenase YgiN
MPLRIMINKKISTALLAALICSVVFAQQNVGFRQANIISPLQQKQMMVRISEIEIDSTYLQEYKAILEEEAAASVKMEPGVIAIFPMYQKNNPTQIRILEMYADKTSYEQHLKTPHFQKYKITTLKMVKSLKLIDMDAIDVATMPLIFRKLKE